MSTKHFCFFKGRKEGNNLLLGAGQAGFLKNQPSLNINSGLNKGKTNRLTSLLVEGTSQQVTDYIAYRIFSNLIRTRFTVSEG
jgi:hypothetical protein